jgi:hypothetical protein
MNPENQDFETLRKLLSVKRHEQPPPGYFNELPNKIWKRIEANEVQPSFWERILPAFALKPAVAYSFGLIICGTLIVTMGSVLKSPDAPNNTAIKAVTQPLAISPIPSNMGMNDSAPQISTPDQGVSSTNPVLDPNAFKPNSKDFAPVSAKPQ